MRITIRITNDSDYTKCVQDCVVFRGFTMAIGLAQMDAKDMVYVPIDGRVDLSQIAPVTRFSLLVFIALFCFNIFFVFSLICALDNSGIEIF